MSEEINANDIVKPGQSVTSICSKKVPKEWILIKKVKNRPELEYIPIDKTILFLNQNFYDSWNSEITHMQSLMVGQFLSTHVAVKLTIRGVSRTGTGADIGIMTKNGVQNDADKISKTAIANALKKATNQFGFGLELWDEGNLPDEDAPDLYRAKIDTCMKVLAWEEPDLSTYVKGLTRGEVDKYENLSEERKKKLTELLVQKCKKDAEVDVK
jgi:hypothetical protein